MNEQNESITNLESALNKLKSLSDLRVAYMERLAKIKANNMEEQNTEQEIIALINALDEEAMTVFPVTFAKGMMLVEQLAKDSAKLQADVLQLKNIFHAYIQMCKDPRFTAILKPPIAYETGIISDLKM